MRMHKVGVGINAWKHYACNFTIIKMSKPNKIATQRGLKVSRIAYFDQLLVCNSINIIKGVSRCELYK